MFEGEKIYIAGPECFYPRGKEMLASMRKKAESYGFGVTLPNDNPLDMSSENLRDHAYSIFRDLQADMNETTILIADLEAYRGSEPDSGTIFEIGMAYAKGALCYGYTRDKRNLACKDQKYYLCKGKVLDEHGKEAPYKELPFSPCVVGAAKIMEGDFDVCLKVVMSDLEAGWKREGRGGSNTRQLAAGCMTIAETPVNHWEGEPDRPRVYLAGPERYDENADKIYEEMKRLCEKHGMHAYTPKDMAAGIAKIETDNPYISAANMFDNCQRHVRNCDVIIANLNDYRGYECSNDVGFECGMAFQLGKRMYGYMDNAGPMKDRVPHLGEEKDFRDFTGANVENFDYPINLMFACSMPIFEGKFENVIQRIAEDLNT